jgi:hypothetical protein
MLILPIGNGAQTLVREVLPNAYSVLTRRFRLGWAQSERDVAE